MRIYDVTLFETDEPQGQLLVEQDAEGVEYIKAFKDVAPDGATGDSNGGWMAAEVGQALGVVQQRYARSIFQPSSDSYPPSASDHTDNPWPALMAAQHQPGWPTGEIITLRLPAGTLAWIDGQTEPDGPTRGDVVRTVLSQASLRARLDAARDRRPARRPRPGPAIR